MRIMLLRVRTTVNIEDDVLRAAKSLAKAEGRSLGEVISRLLRLGLARRREPRSRRGFPVFEVPSDAAALTSSLVAQADDEGGDGDATLHALTTPRF